MLPAAVFKRNRLLGIFITLGLDRNRNFPDADSLPDNAIMASAAAAVPAAVLNLAIIRISGNRLSV